MAKNEAINLRKGGPKVKKDGKDDWPVVRQRIVPVNGKKYRYWMVDSGIVDGKRRKENFKTKNEAEARAEKIRLEQKQIGMDAIRLQDEDKQAAVRALRILNGAARLDEAAQFYITHHTGPSLKKTVAEVYEEFMASKRHSGLSGMTIKGYSWKAGRFARDFAKTALTSITPGDIEAWMNKNKFRGQNRAEYRRHLVILYRFAISRKYAVDNIAAAVSKVTVARKIPAVLTPSEVKALLLAASRYNDGRMLPHFAIGCLCGLRPWELRKLDWSDINFVTKEIYISPEVAKTGQDRFVSMPDNLMAWLRSVPETARTGAISYSRRDFDAVRKAAGLHGKWECDVMRHSAASHLYAMTQNASQVTAQMGHGLSVFMRHYRKTVSKKEGEAYFLVLPDDKEAQGIPATAAVNT